MAFKATREKGNPDFSRLVTVLNNSQLQQTNNPAYQVLKTLIDYAGQTNAVAETKFKAIETEIASVGGGNGNGNGEVEPSDQILAGFGIEIDESVEGEITISTKYYDSPLTDGDVADTQFVFASGDCIIVQVPL